MHHWDEASHLFVKEYQQQSNDKFAKTVSSLHEISHNSRLTLLSGSRKVTNQISRVCFVMIIDYIYA